MYGHLARLLWRANQLVRRQARMIVAQNETIVRLEAEKQCVELAYMRIGRDLMEQFLVALDQPENHGMYRERLFESLGFYRDEIAVREEHVQ